MKKFVLSFVCIAVALLFCGCGTFKMDTSLNINPDESGVFKIKAVMDGFFAGIAMGDEEAGPLNTWDRVSGARIQEYDEGDQHIIEVTVPFKDPKQLEQLLEEPGYRVKYHKRKTLFYDHYQLSFAYPEEFTTSFKEALDSEEENQLFSKEDMARMLGNMFTFKVSISLPGKITETDAPIADGQMVSWTHRPHQLAGMGQLVVSTRRLNWRRVILVFIFLLSLFFEIRKRVGQKKRRGFESTLGEELKPEDSDRKE